MGPLFYPNPLAVKRKRPHADLEEVLGHKFKDQALLARALTHASTRSGGTYNDNERLEFLGDRVLGLAIAEQLLKADLQAREGELAQRFNRMVRGQTCAEIGRDIGLGRFLILSDSEATSGGRDKSTILADAVEALLGAVFMEAGFDKARTVIQNLWGSRLTLIPHSMADPKTALQEWAQGRGLDLPRYAEISRSGPDHAPHFVAEVRVKGRRPARGEGTSKRAAEQAAASVLLKRVVPKGDPAHGGED